MIIEIKNKAFRHEMDKCGLGNIHLYKNCKDGYHYIIGDGINLKDTTIYVNSFNEEPINQWVKDIQALLREND